ncbi:hypothetical protein AMATHDRAFT_126788, partial [Amanita thiersii Skay4041]
IQLPPTNYPLAHLRHLIAQYTQLQPDAFKLIHAGAVMKDDNAPISAYHLKQNSIISIIPHSPLSEPQPTHKFQSPLPLTEQSVISLIHAELTKVRSDVTPDVEAFLDSHGRDQAIHQHKEHTRLGELLLQSLIRLDGITTDGEWDQARRERKAAVREVQALLDRLDGCW